MKIYPIWRDTYYTIETNDTYLSYRIELDGDVIFQGKAYKMPNEDTISININKVCQNYIDSNIEDFMERYKNNQPTFVDDEGGYAYECVNNALRIFTLFRENETEPLETYAFYNNWDYTTLQSESMRVDLNDVINGHYIPNQYLTDNRYKMLLLDCEYNPLENKVCLGPISYRYNEPVCEGRYVLYYENIKGGWNSFLIEGLVTRSEKLKQHTYNKSFDNTTLQFERGRYVVEIETNYVCNTCLLDDKEAERLVRSLLPSPIVYLHDLEEGTIQPVVISNSDNVYKTYENQDMNPVSYEINLTASQTKFRQ